MAGDLRDRQRMNTLGVSESVQPMEEDPDVVPDNPTGFPVDQYVGVEQNPHAREIGVRLLFLDELASALKPKDAKCCRASRETQPPPAILPFPCHSTPQSPAHAAVAKPETDIAGT
jgi:hypothetical protein